MAEVNRRTSRRKLKLTAANSPIVQLSSSQFCCCSECWKTAVSRPLARRSARLAENKPKLLPRPLNHERECSKNSAVYETYGLLEEPQWLLDGHFMYRFSEQNGLLLVDCLRNTYKLLKPRTEWYDGTYVMNLAIGQQNKLHMLRLTKEGDDYERILLHRANDGEISAFAVVEIIGKGVEVKRTVVNGDWSGPIVFLTVDIDEARAVVVGTAGRPYRESEERKHEAHLSADGRELLAIHEDSPHVLQFYSLTEPKWTKHKLDGMDLGNDLRFWYRFSPSGRIYAQGVKMDNGELLFRCNMEQKKWEVVPIEAPEIDDVAVITNSDDGGKDSLAICRRKALPLNVNGQTVERFKIERRMFRNPDSLFCQSFVAVRKLHEGVDVDEVIHELVDAAFKAQKQPNAKKSGAVLQKKFFPSAYEGMEPIPVCSLE